MLLPAAIVDEMELYIQFCAPDDGRRNRLKHVEQFIEINLSIYFYKVLYMFQTVPPPIIRSTKLYIQRQVMSNQYCCLLLSWMRWNGV
jgi:hypothetical protein